MRCVSKPPNFVSYNCHFIRIRDSLRYQSISSWVDSLMPYFLLFCWNNLANACTYFLWIFSTCRWQGFFSFFTLIGAPTEKKHKHPTYINRTQDSSTQWAIYELRNSWDRINFPRGVICGRRCQGSSSLQEMTFSDIHESVSWRILEKRFLNIGQLSVTGPDSLLIFLLIRRESCPWHITPSW